MCISVCVTKGFFGSSGQPCGLKPRTSDAHLRALHFCPLENFAKNARSLGTLRFIAFFGLRGPNSVTSARPVLCPSRAGEEKNAEKGTARARVRKTCPLSISIFAELLLDLPRVCSFYGRSALVRKLSQRVLVHLLALPSPLAPARTLPPPPLCPWARVRTPYPTRMIVAPAAFCFSRGFHVHSPEASGHDGDR